ncbi:MAG: hypothetical protein K2M48_01905, partial [Clostridiales bacterium]|nr:hypothetical protein [Clostridiales bacterium]
FVGSVSCVYETGNYVSVLSKNSDKLEGWYIENDYEKDPAAIEFNAGDFFTLTVNGELNQIVNNGAAVNVNKLPTSDDEGAITGWVIEGTATAFDPATATLTANTSITAVHGNASSGELTGSVALGSGFLAKTYVKFIVTGDAEKTITAYDNTGKSYAVTLGSVQQSWAPSLAGYSADNATYYSGCYIGSSECGLYIKNDGSALWVCDSDDEAIGGAEFK